MSAAAAFANYNLKKKKERERREKERRQALKQGPSCPHRPPPKPKPKSEEDLKRERRASDERRSRQRQNGEFAPTWWKSFVGGIYTDKDGGPLDKIGAACCRCGFGTIPAMSTYDWMDRNGETWYRTIEFQYCCWIPTCEPHYDAAFFVNRNAHKATNGQGAVKDMTGTKCKVVPWLLALPCCLCGLLSQPYCCIHCPVPSSRRKSNEEFMSRSGLKSHVVITKQPSKSSSVNKKEDQGLSNTSSQPSGNTLTEHLLADDSSSMSCSE